jgi:hypothetical protein
LCTLCGHTFTPWIFASKELGFRSHIRMKDQFGLTKDDKPRPFPVDPK